MIVADFRIKICASKTPKFIQALMTNWVNGCGKINYADVGAQHPHIIGDSV